MKKIKAVLLLVIFFGAGLLSGGMGLQAAAAAIIEQPVYGADPAAPTWQYVYYGSFPQSEVSGEKLTQDIISADYDANGDAVVDGTRYRRLLRSEATYRSTGNGFYKWERGTEVYHYFKYEPIRWRVLQADQETLLLLSDQGLTDLHYDETHANITWEKCTLRSWLNSYNETENTYGADHSNNGFLTVAFTPEEIGAIQKTEVVNGEIYNYKLGISLDAGNNTQDYVYLLDINEVIRADYGFDSDHSASSPTRCVGVTDYSHAMGSKKSIDNGKASWWLRTPGDAMDAVSIVLSTGVVEPGDNHTYFGELTVCPVIRVKTAEAENAGMTVQQEQTIAGTESYSTIVNESFILDASANGDGGLTYISDNTKVAEVSSTGEVTAVSSGTAVIHVTAAETQSYKEAQLAITITVGRAAQAVSVAKSSYTKTYGNKAFSINARTSGDGDLAYKSSDKKVAKVSSTGTVTIQGAGKAVITVTALQTDKYDEAVATVALKVRPAKISLKGVKSTKARTALVKWKKTPGVTGYEIAYSTSKDFPKNKGKTKTITVRSAKKASATIKKLKSKKTYYVKIRAYKTVDNGRSYGAYSAARPVKIM